jgi:hypothetical protein
VFTFTGNAGSNPALSATNKNAPDGAFLFVDGAGRVRTRFGFD